MENFGFKNASFWSLSVPPSTPVSQRKRNKKPFFSGNSRKIKKVLKKNRTGGYQQPKKPSGSSDRKISLAQALGPQIPQTRKFRWKFSQITPVRSIFRPILPPLLFISPEFSFRFIILEDRSNRREREWDRKYAGVLSFFRWNFARNQERGRMEFCALAIPVDLLLTCKMSFE